MSTYRKLSIFLFLQLKKFIHAHTTTFTPKIIFLFGGREGGCYVVSKLEIKNICVYVCEGGGWGHRLSRRWRLSWR